jgi:hypothetical protein
MGRKEGPRGGIRVTALVARPWTVRLHAWGTGALSIVLPGAGGVVDTACL